MSLGALMNQPVTIRNAGTTAGYGDDVVEDWGNPTDTDALAWIAQQTASEVLDTRDAAVSTWIGYFPTGTPITAQSRVIRDGVVFEVQGPPNPAMTPRGPHHIEIPLRIVEG